LIPSASRAKFPPSSILAIRSCLGYTKRHEKSLEISIRQSRPQAAVIYARVSSKEQEKEGFSIPAQLKLLKEYAVTNGFSVAQEYVDVETAKQTGRTTFGEMIAFLRKSPSVRVLLVEKTDRLYRNLKDWVTVDELDIEMHFPKEGVVETAFYDRMSNQWREEQNRCQREIERHQNADKSYKDEGVALLDLARNAQRLFASQEPREKRRLLNFLLSNCTWEDGEVVATFRQPFDMLAETATVAAHVEAGEWSKSAKSEIWLGDLDSNQD
jgi:hypothetical protein